MSQADQREEQKAGLVQIAEEFNLNAIYVFGSEAKQVVRWMEGDKPGISVQPQSDVDIGVKPSIGRALTVKEKVDLAANIIRGGRIYCRDEHRTNEYELYILRRAGDLTPLERERISLIMGEDE